MLIVLVCLPRLCSAIFVFFFFYVKELVFGISLRYSLNLCFPPNTWCNICTRLGLEMALNQNVISKFGVVMLYSLTQFNAFDIRCYSFDKCLEALTKCFLQSCIFSVICVHASRISCNNYKLCFLFYFDKSVEISIFSNLLLLFLFPFICFVLYNFRGQHPVK